MAVNLVKGQKVSLTKDKPGLSKIMVGLGWDEVEQPSGFFASLFGSKKDDIDCDASIYVLTNGKLKSEDDMVFFNNKTHKSGSILHHGDNRTGDGDGDDEQVSIELKKLPSDYDRIVIAVNIYQADKRKQHFGMIKNAFIRVVDESNNSELCRFNLTEDYTGYTGAIFGEVYKDGSEWKFNAVGQGIKASYINDIAQMYK